MSNYDESVSYENPDSKPTGKCTHSLTKILDGLTDSNAKLIDQKQKDGEMVQKPFVRWKAMANAGRWYRYGLDLEKTIEQLQKAAAIQYREVYDDEENPVDKNWIRLMGQPK